MELTIQDVVRADLAALKAERLGFHYHGAADEDGNISPGKCQYVYNGPEAGYGCAIGVALPDSVRASIVEEVSGINGEGFATLLEVSEYSSGSDGWCNFSIKQRNSYMEFEELQNKHDNAVNCFVMPEEDRAQTEFPHSATPKTQAHLRARRAYWIKDFISYLHQLADLYNIDRGSLQ